MTDAEGRIVAAADNFTRGLPDYDRGVTSTLVLAAFKAGIRHGRQELAESAERSTDAAGVEAA